jgi:hypothetical protein
MKALLHNEKGRKRDGVLQNKEKIFPVPAVAKGGTPRGGLAPPDDFRYIGGQMPFNEGETMSYTYEQLHEMTVAQLRDIAKGVEHDAVKGFSTMHKEKLIPALCKALGIDAHVHHHVVGLNKAQVKAEIRACKKRRDEALLKKDLVAYRNALKEIHRLKNRLRNAMV